jgi:hypothetical protein
MRWAGNVERTGDIRNAYKILVRNLKRRQTLGEIVVDGRIILKWNTREYGVRAHLARGSTQYPVTDSCEHGNEFSGFMKGGKGQIFYRLSDHWRLKSVSVPWGKVGSVLPMLQQCAVEHHSGCRPAGQPYKDRPWGWSSRHVPWLPPTFKD